MVSINETATVTKVYTHEGAEAAAHDSNKENLLRAVASTLLWEPQYYESGNELAQRIVELVQRVDDKAVAEIAVMARTTLKMRQVPLWVTAALAWKHRNGHPPVKVIEDTIAQVVLRPDQAAEFLAMYWKLNGRDFKAGGKVSPKKLSAQIKKGLARSFNRWSEYNLSKWDESNKAIKVRDALFLAHAKPRNEDQAALWKKLIAGSLETPDTWEVALSSGANKRQTWERLITENSLGYIALLMNLRNALSAGVDESLLREAILAKAKGSWALPYRFINAAKAAPILDRTLGEALELVSQDYQKLPGRTCLVIDVSGSMAGSLGEKTKMNRIDAAGALAVSTRALCEQVAIYATAGNDSKRIHATKQLPDRAGLGMIESLQSSKNELGGGGIFLVQAMDYIDAHESRPFDRVLVFTDEQDCDTDPKKSPKFAKKLGSKSNIIMNVASYKHGIASDGGWTRINGFSEGILPWISYSETGEVLGGN